VRDDDGCVTAAPRHEAGATSGADAPLRDVASTEPTRTSANPIAIPGVKVSSRSATPRTAATAGLTYVNTIGRTGPASAISAKKTRNATAVQRTDRPATDASTRPEGIDSGAERNAAGRYGIAASASDAATTPSAGAPESVRARMIGPTA